MNLNQRPVVLGALVLAGAFKTLAADLHVPAAYATIQAAVDAAVSGDTIHIAPGVYVEQTWIHQKNLTLIGQPGTILRAFPGMEPGLPGVVEWGCIIFISESADVIIRNLTFEGDQMADQNEVGLRGVDFDESGGSVESCRFTGFREATPGSKFGKAIHFFNASFGAVRLQARVINTVIEDSYSGLAIHGNADVTTYDVSVLDNTIAGVGLTTAADALEGLRIGDGTVGKVARNTVRGFAYDGPFGPGIHPIPFGIVYSSAEFPNPFALEPMTFEDNVLQSNQVHMAFFNADDSVVRNNTFDGGLSPDGEVSSGLWFSGADVEVSSNLFRNLDEGIYLDGSGSDPFGVATDAMLFGNRFCDVTSQVVAEPGATFAEQGTLLCPFPEPVLKILSSPGIEQGFSVQSATDPSGP